MSLNVEPFLHWLELGVSTIPCKKVWDEKKKIYTGKLPAIKEWERFSKELPTEDDILAWERLNNVWGMAIVCGPASNICCIDIDTEDEDLQRRILDNIPHSPIRIIGDRKRYGKLLYKISEDIIPDSFNFTKTRIMEPGGKKTAVDFFFSNSYIVIPPSLHSCDEGNTNSVFYNWEKIDLDEMALKHLPVLDLSCIERVRMAFEGLSPKQISDHIPGQLPDEEVVGRWQQITHLASNLIRERTPFEVAVGVLLKFDRENFSENMYFLDKTKGSATISPRLNAYKFYSDMLISVNRKKTSDFDLEIPTLQDGDVEITQEWDEPIPLDKRLNGGIFQPNWIPENIRETIMAASESTSVDPAMVFFYMMGTFSALIGNKVIIQPYQKNQEYTESCNLYVGIIAKSGERKSETTKLAKKPLMKIQAQLIENMRYFKKASAIENENIEIRINKVKLDIRKEVAENGIMSPNAKKMHEEIAALEKKKVEYKELSVYEQENTAESYFQIAEKNPNGIFLEFNEWGAAYTNLQQKENTKLRRFILDGWDGQNPFSYKTKNSGENYIEKLCLSVGFCTQEDIMSNIMWSLINARSPNDGLMQRFLLVLSDSKYREVSDTRIIFPQSIYTIFENAYKIEAKSDRVHLDDEAYESWIGFLKHNQNCKKEELTSVLESFYSKYDGLVIRIASNLAIFRNNGNRPDKISGLDMHQAISIIEYFRENLKAVARLSEQTTLHEIVRLFKIGAIPEDLTIRDAYRSYPHLFGYKADVAIERLKKLHDHNYIKIMKQHKNYTIKVNPRIKS